VDQITDVINTKRMTMTARYDSQLIRVKKTTTTTTTTKKHTNKLINK